MIEAALKQLELPADAYDWLLDVWMSIQLFDDVADGDPVRQGDLKTVIHAVFVRMPLNPFYRANISALTPVLAVQIAKWNAANAVEASGQSDERSYMWRAGYYDLVLAVCLLCFGKDVSVQKACDALRCYGETYDEYKREMSNA